MNSFLIALQFLSRIHLATQTVWTNEDFGRSVIFFPLVGTIIGAFLVFVYFVVSAMFAPLYMAVLVCGAWLYITGGLHTDGYMDTADGILSGRSRERMLEILKDSRVGSSGVMAFVFLVLLKVSFLASLPESIVPLCLLSIPTASRLGALVSIFAFPYARKEGLGRAFIQYRPKHVFWKGGMLALIPVFYAGPIHAAFLGAGLGMALLMNRYICRYLGGVTGDTYGAVIEGSEMVLLGIAAILSSLPVHSFINTI